MAEPARTSEWTISEVGRRIGLRPSTIRYYEQIGIIEPALRVAGQRRYDQTSLYRLTVIKRARALGFTLTEIRSLFFAFPEGVPAAARWKQISQQKLTELTRLMGALSSLKVSLEGQGACGCASLDECGKCIVENEQMRA